jgi:hypothetical protein
MKQAARRAIQFKVISEWLNKNVYKLQAVSSQVAAELSVKGFSAKCIHVEKLAGSCEHGNETSDPRNCRQVINQQQDSAPSRLFWNYFLIVWYSSILHTLILSKIIIIIILLFDLWGYWHCGHSWPIVPASGDSEDDCGEADGIIYGFENKHGDGGERHICHTAEARISSNFYLNRYDWLYNYYFTMHYIPSKQKGVI